MPAHERVLRACALLIDAALDELAANRGTTQARLAVGDQRTLEKLAYSVWRACEQAQRAPRGSWEAPEERETPVVPYPWESAPTSRSNK